MAKESKEGKNKRKEESAESSRWDSTLLAVNAERFKALGDPTRLAVIGFLMSWESNRTVAVDGYPEAADDGATVSEIASALTGKNGKEPSTLSHHLKELRHAGLIAMTRHGKNLHYRAEVPTITLLCEHLCCTNTDKGEILNDPTGMENGS